MGRLLDLADRVTRRGSVSPGAGAIIAVAACLMLSAFACSGEREPVSSGDVEDTVAAAEARALHVDTTAEPTRRLERNGVSIIVPADWDGRILFRDAAGSWGVIFQVANFELPPNEGFEPPRELPPGEEDPIKAMGAGDVLVTVVSDEAGGDRAPATIALDDLREARRVPRGHTLAERSFCYRERCIRIEVDFGARAPEPTLRTQVDDVLASLAVEQGLRPADAKPDDDSPRGCPRENWPGPWAACAEADWVRRVVESGGYRVVGETGSALVAEGKGHSFYAWTTPAARHPAAIADEAGNSRRLAVVHGVAVYGDDLWRFWEAQGFIFWVNAGPTQDSIVPSPAALARIIEASGTTQPPVE
jgi:hypothetical protein